MRPPPDAGVSALGHWTLASPMVVWMLTHAPDLLACRPKALVSRRGVLRCPPPCYKAMVRRPGAWKCYRHDPPYVREDGDPYERAPELDVLGRTGELLDWQIDPHTGEYAIVARPL